MTQSNQTNDKDIPKLKLKKNLNQRIKKMVCISCIVIPVVLYLWHRFLQPLVLKIWNPWGKVEDKSNTNDSSVVTATLPKCPLSNGVSKSEESEKEIIANGKGKQD